VIPPSPGEVSLLRVSMASAISFSEIGLDMASYFSGSIDLRDGAYLNLGKEIYLNLFGVAAYYVIFFT